MKHLKDIVVLAVIIAITVCVSLVSLAGIGGNKLSAGNINLGLDLAGGVYITYQAEEGTNPSAEEMDGALSVIQRRLDSKGYTEATAMIDGTNRIRVEIPGVKDASDAVEEIGRTAMLRFIGIDLNGLLSSSVMEEFYQLYLDYVRESIALRNEIDPENDLQSLTDEEILQDAKTYFNTYILDAMNLFPQLMTRAIEAGYAEVVVTGINVNDASYQKGEQQGMGGVQPYVNLKFDNEGSRLFEEGTRKFLNKRIAILLDDTCISMPTVSAVITGGNAVINGIGNDQEAKTLADDIRGGALPVQLVDIEHNSVGASLGHNALETSIMAGIIGFAIIILFMLIFYRVPGLAASIALIFYASTELLLINAFGWTLTLAGIAGFVLSIGMAVDANIIIFSRIREELNLGRTVRVATRNGFNMALSAILDGNITTLIASIVLYVFGSGTIKGFAQTLGLGIILSMISALVVTRFLLTSLEGLLPDAPVIYGKKAAKAAKEVKA